MRRELRLLGNRVGPWPRRVLALTCALLAAVTTLDPRAAPARGQRSTVAVLVATGTLAAGHVLTRRDVSAASWPAGVVPVGALGRADRAVGRRLASPMGRGEPVTAARLVGHDLTDGLPEGTVATSISLADPHAADLVHAGDLVDVLATPGGDEDPAGRPTVVASGVLVLAVLSDRPSGSSAAGSQLILGTSRVTAVRLAGEGSRSVFAVLAHSP